MGQRPVGSGPMAGNGAHAVATGGAGGAGGNLALGFDGFAGVPPLPVPRPLPDPLVVRNAAVLSLPRRFHGFWESLDPWCWHTRFFPAKALPWILG